jgi:hypothetical protein
MESLPGNQFVHVMVDIETYDVNPSAVILSIGAAEISLDDKPTPCVYPYFYTELDINTQFERTKSIDTMNWWAAQGNPPIHGSLNIIDALGDFSSWLARFKKTPIIWCKGTNFDVVILTHAFNQFSIPIPWKYNNVRDCRTIFKIAGITPRKAGHNALDDAIDQAKDLRAAMKLLGEELA